MTVFVALLRAVNVGGTGKLPMAELKAMCEALGGDAVRTYIASGNAVFRSARSEGAVKAALEAGLQAYAGKPVGVMVRSAAEIAAIVAANPFPAAPPGRVVVIFLDDPVSPALLDDVSGRADNEELRLGRRELYVHYGGGIGRSKLRIPAARHGTGRNMNTVARLADMAAG